MTPTNNGRRAIEAYAAMRFDPRPVRLVEPMWLVLGCFSLLLVVAILWSAI